MDVLVFPTALGWILLGWTHGGLSQLRFLGPDAQESQPTGTVPPWVNEAAHRICTHLAGDPQDLSDLPLDLGGLPPFRCRVAEILRATRPGDVLTYGDVARLAGSPGASRAVGQAVKHNPLLLLIPCHRVVAQRGEGGWSAFGSMDIKQRLRALECPKPDARVEEP